MRVAEPVRVLDDAEALDAIERALHGKLRAHRLSEAFIDRHRDDSIQQGLAEYERARAQGGEIENPGAWVVKRAYLRAIDELRREERIEGGEDALTASERHQAEAISPTEVEAIGNVEIVRLRAVIGKLSTEQRQALGLYYFEERSTREAAEVLGCGQSTFRRRLDSALRVLRQRFGVAMPEPGSELAIEVGITAWLSLAGARVVPTHGLVDQLLGVADALRSAAEEFVGRGRDMVARILASGGGDGIGATASGPLGKAAGGLCAGALTACALTGVIGSGVRGVDLVGRHDQPGRPKSVHRHIFSSDSFASESKAKAPGSQPRTIKVPVSPSHRSGESGSGASASKRKREARQVKQQTDGFARAASESSGVSPPPTPVVSASSTEPASSPTQSGSSASTSASEEEAQATQQFGAFK
ncbi:MAG: sigma-70 family RNA polymerase sigma factor [Solirubrobacterales bacterium]